MSPKNKIRHITGSFIALILVLVLCSGCTQVDSDGLANDILEEFAEVIDLDPFDVPSGFSEDEQLDLDEDIMQKPVGAGEDKEQAVPGADNESQERLLVVSDGDYLLALVCKETTLKRDYKPKDLQPVPAYMNPSYNMQLRAEALENLEALWQAAKADGVTLHIRSAYRSYDTQDDLFESYASRYGEEEANRFSARPGQSEHQLGTTVDFGGTAVDFKPAFALTPQGLWLAKNAHYYGFAMSYPEGMEHITGYIFEPFHFRYIGTETAAYWKASGNTLKEYLENRTQFFE